MDLPHVQPLDRLAAEEIASLCVRLERIDADLDERGHFGRSGARSLLEHKARLGRELRAWLREFGGTPRARWSSLNSCPARRSARQLPVASVRSRQKPSEQRPSPGRSWRRSRTATFLT